MSPEEAAEKLMSATRPMTKPEVLAITSAVYTRGFNRAVSLVTRALKDSVEDE